MMALLLSRWFWSSGVTLSLKVIARLTLNNVFTKAYEALIDFNLSQNTTTTADE